MVVFSKYAFQLNLIVSNRRKKKISGLEQIILIIWYEFKLHPLKENGKVGMYYNFVWLKTPQICKTKVSKFHY